jgi:hypothetical protein
MKPGLKKDALNAFLAATAGIVVMRTLPSPEEQQQQAIITEQQNTIRRLTAEKAQALLGTPATEKSAEESSAVLLSQFRSLENDFYYNLSVSCQFGWDPVSTAINHRNSCQESRLLNNYMQRMYSQCLKAEYFAVTPQEKEVLKKAEEQYQAYRSNYRISPPQCGKPPELE